MTTALIRRISALLGAVVLLGVALFAVPASAQYGTFVNCVELNEQERTVVLEGDGFEPGTTINLFAEQGASGEIPIGTTVAGADTSFSVVVPVPAEFDLSQQATYIARGFRADGEQETVSTDPLELTTPDLDPENDPCLADDPGDDDGGDDGGQDDGGGDGTVDDGTPDDGNIDDGTVDDGSQDDGGDDTNVLPDEVTPTPTADVEGDLAFTGSNTVPMVTIAVGAIALGSLVLFGVRSRRTQS